MWFLRGRRSSSAFARAARLLGGLDGGERAADDQLRERVSNLTGGLQSAGKSSLPGESSLAKLAYSNFG